VGSSLPANAGFTLLSEPGKRLVMLPGTAASALRDAPEHRRRHPVIGELLARKKIVSHIQLICGAVTS
jgi:hypothetical protein